MGKTKITTSYSFGRLFASEKTESSNRGGGTTMSLSRLDTQSLRNPLNPFPRGLSERQRSGGKQSELISTHSTLSAKRESRTPTPEHWQAHAWVIVEDTLNIAGYASMAAFTGAAVESIRHGGFFIGGLFILGLVPSYLLTTEGRETNDV
jgi:hypothetical protein